MYAPHILQLRGERVVRNEYNQTVAVETVWNTIGPCRCDDNATDSVIDDNGRAFIPRYHMVAARYNIKAGDYVRAMVGDEVRGEGEVRRVIKTNYLDYMSIYV